MFALAVLPTTQKDTKALREREKEMVIYKNSQYAGQWGGIHIYSVSLSYNWPISPNGIHFVQCCMKRSFIYTNEIFQLEMTGLSLLCYIVVLQTDRQVWSYGCLLLCQCDVCLYMYVCLSVCVWIHIHDIIWYDIIAMIIALSLVSSCFLSSFY